MATASVVNGPSSSAAGNRDQQYQRRLRVAAMALLEQRQPTLVELIFTITLTSALDDDMRDVAVLGDRALFDDFRHYIRRMVLRLRQLGYDEHEISHDFPHLVLRAAEWASEWAATAQPYRSGGFSAVAASAAAVRSLENQTFRGAGVAEGGCGVTECSICFGEFVDGELVSVMPCPRRGHRFHPDCIAKWLGISNTCPLCRHELRTAGDV